jgi:hypothetical protein
MTYKLSRARKDAEHQISLIVRDAKALYRTAQQAGAGQRLLSLYYVAGFSQLEVYVKSIFDESFAALRIAGAGLRDWPDEMLGYLIHSGNHLGYHYKRYYFDSDDENKLIRQLAASAKQIGNWHTNQSLSPNLRSVDFLSAKKYPSPKNLPQLFRRIGIHSIWNDMGRAGRFNAELTLTSLNDLRTNIVHEGRLSQGLSLIDMQNRLNQIRHFIGILDRVIAKHFCGTLISRSAWNTHVC